MQYHRFINSLVAIHQNIAPIKMSTTTNTNTNTNNLNSKEELEKLIVEQGDIVRKLKENKATTDPKVITAAIDKLKELKAKLELLLSKNEPEELSSIPLPAEGEAIVTPWEVTGDVDYNKLISRFGSTAIDQNLLDRIEKIIKKPVHHFLRRGLFFSHRDLELILKLKEEGKTFYLYTGRGNS